MHSWERVMDTLSVQRLQPHKTNGNKKGENEKLVEDKNFVSNFTDITFKSPALKVRQSHTIKYRVGNQDR